MHDTLFALHVMMFGILVGLWGVAGFARCCSNSNSTNPTIGEFGLGRYPKLYKRIIVIIMYGPIMWAVMCIIVVEGRLGRLIKPKMNQFEKWLRS